MDSRLAYCLLVAGVGVERLYELQLTRRNWTRARARGGREAEPPWQYRAMVAFHTLLLLAAPTEVLLLKRPFQLGLGVAMLGIVVLAQALRYWAVATLGERWMTRVVVVPGDSPIVSGPYRFVRHPNYLAVVLEVLALPLVHGAWLTALVGSILNAGLLGLRIRSEEAALRTLLGYDALLAPKGRLLPRFWKRGS